MADVAVILGSASDNEIADRVCSVLAEHGVSFDCKVLSAHREPEKLDAYLQECTCSIYIAIAGLSAALPGVIASRTDRPVIGVPVSGTLLGIDALLSIAQMPRGVPVATVGVDAAENAALLAVRILALAAQIGKSSSISGSMH
ncbi:MAG: 5-(carboxyamino)imidazole ribonucleotide mutase [Methanomicrobiales archaeon]|nr:5-(carboxyamino)imidazole ribonucleotide mutase [Methanomicrobiales archaeon]